MVLGALKNSPADLSVAITGIAGPGGGSSEKPVGLVQFAAASRNGKAIAREERFGDLGRGEIRAAFGAGCAWHAGRTDRVICRRFAVVSNCIHPQPIACMLRYPGMQS